MNSQLKLIRYPQCNRKNLRAWDAADEYLLEQLNQQYNINESDNVLIFNDNFGAITLTLIDSNPTAVSDSFLSQQGLIENCKINNIDPSRVEILNSLDHPNKIYDYVLIKIPKSLDYLHYFLVNIRANLHTDTVVILAGMIKHMPNTIWKLLENTLGTTRTSLAKKKAKLITVAVEKNQTTSKYPIRYTHDQMTIYNHAAVFSKQSLDIGTRFLLNNFPLVENPTDIIDLGCGNGIIGLKLAQLYPNANITLTDESHMAIESAKLTLSNNLNLKNQINYRLTNCLDGFNANSADLIVCNPPFHQSQSIGTQIAIQMFQHAYKTLRKNGCFIVIANRHLPYFTPLKKIFHSINCHSSNQKFNIYVMRK